LRQVGVDARFRDPLAHSSATRFPRKPLLIGKNLSGFSRTLFPLSLRSAMGAASLAATALKKRAQLE